MSICSLIKRYCLVPNCQTAGSILPKLISFNQRHACRKPQTLFCVIYGAQFRQGRKLFSFYSSPPPPFFLPRRLSVMQHELVTCSGLLRGGCVLACYKYQYHTCLSMELSYRKPTHKGIPNTRCCDEWFGGGGGRG